MKPDIKSQIIENTVLQTFPKKLRESILKELKLGNVLKLDEGFLMSVRERVDKILESRELSTQEISMFFTERNIGFTDSRFQPTEETLKFAISVFKQCYGRGVLIEDLFDISKGGNNKTLINIDEIRSTNRYNYRILILGEKNLNEKIKVIESICGMIGIKCDLRECISSIFFTSVLNGRNIQAYVEGLNQINGFDFNGFLDVDLFSIINQVSVNYFLKLVEYFGIKNIKDIEKLQNTELLKFDIAGRFDGVVDLDGMKKLESYLGRKFSLEEAGNGTLANVDTIHAGIKNYKIQLGTVGLIFDYLDKENVGVGALDYYTLSNFITFCRWFGKANLKEQNLEEKVEVLRDIIGVDLDLEWFSNKELFNFLQIVVGNAGTMRPSEESNEQIYKKFFQKFPQYTGIDENGEEYSETWDKKHFKKENGELIWILLQEVSLKFINLFTEEFKDISGIENNESFMFWYNNVPEGDKNQIVKFITFVRKYKLFKIKFGDIDKDFLVFISKNFDFQQGYISNNINFPEGFFDEEISSFKDFSYPLLKTLILNEGLFVNLSCLCEVYNLPITLSSFRMIDEKFNAKYGGTILNITLLQSDQNKELLFVIELFSKGFGKEINIENLLYVFQNSVSELMEINFDGLGKEKDKITLLQETFFPDNEQKFYREFFRQENGNIVLNRDKSTLLKMIFDPNVELPALINFIFLANFSGVNLGKLVKFYRDSNVGLSVQSNSSYVGLKWFLVQYSLDKNNYYYLDHNLNILEFFEDTGIEYLFHRDNTNEKLKTILDKTGGFLTKTLVIKFIVKICSEEELDRLIVSYREVTQKILSSEKIELGKVDNNIAEAIFMAYRPTGFTIEQIKHKLEWELRDNTDHLEKVSYNPDGYEKEFSRSEKRLRQGENVNLKVIGKVEEDVLKSKKEKEAIDFESFDFKRFFGSATTIEELYPILAIIYSLNHDYRIEEYRKHIGKGEYDYTRVYTFSEIFGLITKDSFDKEIGPVMFTGLNFETLKTIFSKLEKIKDPKFKSLFNERFRKEYLEDEAKLRTCFKDLFFTQLSFIASRIKKEIDKELKKFGNVLGEGDKVRFNICKNIASFFAMAGSELCTASNVYRHNEERYIPVNIIDDSSKQIIGMLMMYVELGRDYLIVRGFNLRNKMYEKYDIYSVTETMVDFVRDFAVENGYKKVYIPENGFQHLVSNFDGLRKSISKISSQNIGKPDYEKQEKFEGGQIGQEGGFTAYKLYLLLDL